MKYKSRPGIVLTNVCGVRLLVPDRKASDYCPYVIRLPFAYAFVWSILAAGKSTEDIYKAYAILTKKPAEEVKIKVDTFLKELYDKGFLITAEDSDNA